MAILITFSGSVGSGKSCSAKWVRQQFEQNGRRVSYLRFRFLSLKYLFGEPRRSKQKKVKSNKVNGAKRFENFIPPEFTLKHVVLYLWRAVQLRLILAVRYRDQVVIIDRYYYDNLVQFSRLDKYRKKILLLTKVYPVPDLAIIMDTEVSNLLKRRGIYSEDYLEHIVNNYRELNSLIPSLSYVNTNELEQINGRLEKLIEKFISHSVEEDKN